MITKELLEEAAEKQSEFLDIHAGPDREDMDPEAMEAAMKSIGVDMESVAKFVFEQLEELLEMINQAVEQGEVKPGGGRIWRMIGGSALTQGIIWGVWAQRLKAASEVDVGGEDDGGSE